jgi:hypothetical protein
MSQSNLKQEIMYPCVYEERFKDIDRKLDSLTEIQQSLKNIEIAIAGSEKLGIKGIASRLNSHATAIMWLQRIVYIGIGAISTISIIYQVVKDFSK